MGLGGSGQGGDSGSASGFFPGSHERSPRGEPWLSERRRGRRGRPGRLRPCLASQALAAAAAGERGALSPGPPPGPAAPRRGPTDRPLPTDRRTDRQGLGTQRVRALPPGPPPLAPGPWFPSPRGGPGVREGRRSCGTPAGGSRAAGAGELRVLSPRRRRTARQPPRGVPWGRCAPPRGRPAPGSADPRERQTCGARIAVIPVRLAKGSIPTPRLGGLGLFMLMPSAFCSWFSMALKLQLPYAVGKGKKGEGILWSLPETPRIVWRRREKVRETPHPSR